MTQQANVRNWLSQKGINPDVALAAGVRYSPRRNSLLYPRYNREGRRVGWKIRELEGPRQYNEPPGIPLRDTIPFTASEGSTDSALVICEGETDALAFASTYDGYHVIGVPGATAFANEWAGYYSKYDSVYLFPDADEAGANLVDKVCGLIMRTRVVSLPNGMDVSDAVVNGLDLQRRMLDAAPVVSTKPLRRTSYTFSGEISVSPGRLLELVGTDTILRRRGNEWIGLCPFHQESTPSFMVNPEKGLFYCHGCNTGGDAIAYLRNKGYTWREAKERVT